MAAQQLVMALLLGYEFYVLLEQPSPSKIFREKNSCEALGTLLRAMGTANDRFRQIKALAGKRLPPNSEAADRPRRMQMSRGIRRLTPIWSCNEIGPCAVFAPLAIESRAAWFLDSFLDPRTWTLLARPIPPLDPKRSMMGPSPSSRAWQEKLPQATPARRRVARYRGLSPPGELAAMVRIDIDVRWRRSDARPAESYLSRFPALANDPELAVDIIYAEYLARERAGRCPAGPSVGAVSGVCRGTIKADWPAPHGLETADDEADAEGAPSELSRRLFESPANSPETRSATKFWRRLAEAAWASSTRRDQVALNRFVALKMVRAVDAGNQELLARFRSEARAVASLHHPHIVQVYDFGEHDGLPFWPWRKELIEGEKETLAASVCTDLLGPPAKRQSSIKLAEAVQLHTITT